jgi:RimJ/RimL family protein N-acetyltransferase
MPRLEDAAAVAEYLADPVVMRYLGGATVPRVEAPAVVQRWLDRWRENGIGHLVIEHDGRILGRIGFVVWDSRTWSQATFAEAGEHAQPELGWALARAHWGQGYATEAAFAARAWARRDRQFEPLISLIASANVASQRVAHRLGARPGRTVTLASTETAVVWEHPEDSV